MIDNDIAFAYISSKIRGNFYDYEALELQKRAIYRKKSCSVDAA